MAPPRVFSILPLIGLFTLSLGAGLPKQGPTYLSHWQSAFSEFLKSHPTPKFACSLLNEQGWTPPRAVFVVEEPPGAVYILKPGTSLEHMTWTQLLRPDLPSQPWLTLCKKIHALESLPPTSFDGPGLEIVTYLKGLPSHRLLLPNPSPTSHPSHFHIFETALNLLDQTQPKTLPPANKPAKKPAKAVSSQNDKPLQ